MFLSSFIMLLNNVFIFFYLLPHMDSDVLLIYSKSNCFQSPQNLLQNVIIKNKLTFKERRLLTFSSYLFSNKF